MRISSIVASVVIGLASLTPSVSRAADSAWRLDINVASIHTEQWARQQLNQSNPGIGLTWRADRTWAVASGVYWNSYRRSTCYALGEWTPLHIGRVHSWHVDAGLAGGLASGYRRDEVPSAPFAAAAIIRVAAPGGLALNVIGVPNTGHRNSGFVGFQLSFSL